MREGGREGGRGDRGGRQAGSERRRSGEEAGREKRGVEGGNQVQRRRTGGVGQCEDLGSGKGMD